MSKLVQIGYNPGFPVVIQKYWRYTIESAPPVWLTDQALIKEVTEWPVLSVQENNTGGFNILSATGGTSLVHLETADSIIFLDPATGQIRAMTPHQQELLYEEKEK